MSNTPESKDNTFSSIGAYISIAGVLVTVSTFLSLYYSWSFSRGFLLGLNLPTSLIGISKAFEVFPQAGIQWVGLDLSAIFIILLWQIYLGDLNKQIKDVNNSSAKVKTHPHKSKFLLRLNYVMDWLKKLITVLLSWLPYVFALILVAIMMLTIIEPSGLLFDTLFTFSSVLAPIFIGAVFINNALEFRRKVVFTVILIIITVEIQAYNIYSFGKSITSDIQASKISFVLNRGNGVFNLGEMPFVNITSDVPIQFQTSPIITNGNYLYRPTSPDFIILIFSDENNYYFVESTSKSLTLAISKAKIIAIEYLNGSP